jgi:hypothetical protein
MILEHFENGSNQDIAYDEDKGMFITKDKSLLKLFNMGNVHIYDKNISINKINELRETSNNTTLTNCDIDMLYKFASIEFNYDKDKNAFVNEPLKNIFGTLGNDKLIVSKLIMTAFDYIRAVERGEKPVIEKFDGNDVSNINEFDKSGILVFCCIVSCLFFLYFLYLCSLCYSMIFKKN